MSMIDSRLKPNTTAPSAPGSVQVPGSAAPRWRSRGDARAIALSARAAWAAWETAAVSFPVAPGPAGAATNASRPHTAPQYAALGASADAARPAGGRLTGRGFVAEVSGVVYAA